MGEISPDVQNDGFNDDLPSEFHRQRRFWVTVDAPTGIWPVAVLVVCQDAIDGVPRSEHRFAPRLDIGVGVGENNGVFMFITVLDVISIFTGWLFYLDENKHYQSGEWFNLQTTVNYVYLLVPTINSVIKAIKANSRSQRQECLTYALYMNVLETIRSYGVIPVLGLKDPQTAPLVAEALRKGGLPLVEVTLRNEGALAWRWISTLLPFRKSSI